jgi:multisubunit Na+/H+ antiporter MnhC subunit
VAAVIETMLIAAIVIALAVVAVTVALARRRALPPAQMESMRRQTRSRR